MNELDHKLKYGKIEVPSNNFPNLIENTGVALFWSIGGLVIYVVTHFVIKFW